MDILLAILLLALSASFAYKCFVAVFYGRTPYWTGFLPITVVSPFFLHWPATRNSLIKTTHGLWVHLLLGPTFFILSLMFLCAGMDYLGFPAADTINHVFTFGRKGSSTVISYSRETGYRFPIVKKLQDKFVELLSKPVFEKEHHAE